MNSKTQLISRWLLALSALAFLLLYFVLSFYNRPANEDVVFISFIKNKGLTETTSWIYNNWTGRWASTIYYYSIMSAAKTFANIHYIYFVYHSITLFILVYAIQSLLKTVASNVFQLTLDKFTTYTIGILFIAGFYFSTFMIPEAWWWIYATVDHLQGIVFFLLGTSILFKQNNRLVHYLLIAFCFIYIGGSYEIYTLILLTLFVISIAALKYLGKRKLTDFYYYKALITALLSLLIAAIVCFVAPGNLKRRSAYNRETSSAIIQNTACPIGIKELQETKNIVTISIAALSILLGVYMKERKVESIGIKKMMLFLALLVFISICITYAFQIFILRDYLIPLRGWTFTSFALFTFMCSVFLYAGYHLKNAVTIKLSMIVIPAITFILLSTYTYRQFNFTSVYAMQYDALIKQLILEKQNKEIKIVEVDHLSESGMLMPFEIGTEYINDPIKDILDLDYNIHLKE